MDERLASSKVRVGDWVILPSLSRIERDGQRVSLEPLGMALLLYLAHHPDRVISTNELIEQVWRGQIVSDGTVYQWIHKLRKVLGDDSHHPRYIQTIPKTGYQLVARVEFVGARVAGPVWSSNRHRIATAAVVLIVSIAALVFYARRISVDESIPEPPRVDPRSIAVLPFEQLSDGPDDAFFAAGVHNNLLVQLTKIADLKVISRGSVLEYAGAGQSLKRIGDELGVATVLQGSYQRNGESIQVTAMLSEVASDRLLWGDRYQGELSAESIFSIQAVIATEIAAALRATLTPREVTRLREIPTESLPAWDSYLRGMDYFRRADDRVYMPMAVELLESAVEQDSDFALGWAALSDAHSRMHWYELDPSRDHSALALATARRALAIAPDLPEAHVAMSSYYQLITRDYDRALQEIALAEEGMPGAAELFERRAFILRRQGKWEASAANFQRALDLDPRNVDLLIQQSGVFQYSRRCDEAIANLKRVTEIAPAHPWGDFLYVINQSLCYGDTAPAREAAAMNATMRFRELTGWTAALYERDFDTALAYLDQWDFDVHMFNYTFIPKASFYGVTYHFAQRHDLSQRAFEDARAYLEERLVTHRDDARLYVSLGEAYLGLGRRNEALTLAYKAMELLPMSRDVMLGSDIRREVIVRILAPAGDLDAVIEQMELYLSGPGRWALDGLLVDPAFDLVRDDPRFLALVEKYSRA